MRAQSSCLRVGALVRLAFALAGASALAGCSSDSQRFNSLFASVQPQQIQPVQLAQPIPGVDGTTTASIAKNGVVRPSLGVGQQNVMQPLASVEPVVQPQVEQQTYRPVSAQPLAAPAAVARTKLPTATSNPIRKAVEPISIPTAEPETMLEPVAVQTPVVKPKLAPVSTAAVKNPTIDPLATGSVAPKAPSRGGWSAVNGTRVIMREGETVYNLSRRFGVPASEILRVNGIEKAGAVATGQELIIPTYQYSANAGVSAPDANPDTAIAKGSRGTIFDIPADKVPLPSNRPSSDVAVLPTVPQVKSKNGANVDNMSVGSLNTQKPADPNATSASVKAKVDQPLAVEPVSGDGRYKVVSGDSLHAIAKKTGVTVGQLRAANGLDGDSKLKVGQVLNLPKNAGDVAAIDGVDASTTGTRKPRQILPSGTDATVTASTPAAAEPKKPEAPSTQATNSKGLRWPVQGKVATAFRAADNGKPNDGIDIDVPAGTPVKAAEGGTVIYSGNGLAEFGNTVLIKHDNGLVTVYGHADKLNVQRGQKVSKGDVIAVSGASGKAKMPKLHFEVRKNSVPVDPTTYLQ
jgi:murein DD-endopeptidase MepM/ murein hydrolase activator NlpD